MPIERLATATFRDEVAKGGVLAIEFGVVPSDGLASAQREVEHVRFAYVDPTADPEIGSMFGLSDGPALLIFRDRVVLYFEAGEHAAERTIELVRRVQALDMDAVHAAIDEEKRSEIALRMRRVCPTARRGPSQQ